MGVTLPLLFFYPDMSMSENGSLYEKNVRFYIILGCRRHDYNAVYYQWNTRSVHYNFVPGLRI